MPVSTDAILATAGCTEEPTFAIFYIKPIAVTNQISWAILDLNYVFATIYTIQVWVT